MKHGFNRITAPISIACALTCLAFSGQALADDTSLASASAKLTQLSYQLVDLDPNDGIAPSLTLFNNGIYTTYYQSIGPLMGESTDSSFSPVQSTQGLTAAPGASSTSSFEGTQTSLSSNADTAGFNASSVLKLNGFLSNVADPNTAGWGLQAITAGLGSGAHLATNNPEGQPFQLSAKAMLVVSGTAQISGQFNTSALQAGLAGLPNPSQPVTALEQKLLYGDTGPQNLASAQVSVEIYSSDANLAPSSYFLSNQGEQFDQSDSFELQFTNSGDTPLDMLMMIDATTNLHADAALSFVQPTTPNVPTVPSIPEPSTWMLMGLGLVGMTLTRRRFTR